MMIPLRPDLIGVRHPWVWHYLLVEKDRVTALDTGLGFAGYAVRRWMKKQGRPPEQLQHIILTHGHIDHAGCARGLQQWSGAQVHLHREDLPILHGEHRYEGRARHVGRLESAARWLTRSQPPKVDHFLEEGQKLDLWGGLEIYHIPGHTPGHVVVYCPSKRLLFVGDAIVCTFNRACFPLRMLNVDNRLLRESVVRLAEFDADWVYPMHHLHLRHNLMDDLKKYAQQYRAQQEAN